MASVCSEQINGDTLFNWMRPDSSRPFLSSCVAILQTCLGFFITLFLAIPPSAHAQSDSEEMDILKRALRGFVAIAYPDGGTNQCAVREASQFALHQSDSYRNWYHLAIESQCPGEMAEVQTIWFVCARRSSISCSVIAAPPAPPSDASTP